MASISMAQRQRNQWRGVAWQSWHIMAAMWRNIINA